MSAFTDRFAETAKDPVSAFYKFLWTRFDSTTILSPLIKVNNRITFHDRDSGVKDNVAEADCPEVMLTFGSISRRGANSSEDLCVVFGTWTIATGTQKYYNEVTYVTWLINLLMGKIEHETCVGINFSNITLGNLTTPEEMPFGYMDPATNRGIKGYASKVNLRAELYYSRTLYDDTV